jgi:hypothetical protein
VTISTASRASGLSGFVRPQNRRYSAAATEAPGSRANHLQALSEQEDELRDYERLCQRGQTMIHALMSRPMPKRLARAWPFFPQLLVAVLSAPIA